MAAAARKDKVRRQVWTAGLVVVYGVLLQLALTADSAQAQTGVDPSTPCPGLASESRYQERVAQGRQEYTTLHSAYEAYNTGVACSRQDKDCLAMSHYLAAIELRPSFQEAYGNLAHVYASGCSDADYGLLQPPDTAQALLYHRLAVEHSTDDNFYVAALSNLYVAGSREEGGKDKHTLLRHVKTLQEGLQRLPQNKPWPDNPHFTLSVLYTDSGQTEKGYSVLQDMLQNHPKHSMALLNAGNYHFLRSDYGRALAWYERAGAALQEQNDQSEYLNRVLLLCNIGQCHRELDQLPYAEQAFLKAVLFLQDPGFALEQRQRENPYRRGLEAFTAANLHAIQTLGCSWNHLENLELILEQSVRSMVAAPQNFSSDSIGAGGLVDPYSFTLHRYASREADVGNSRRVCQDTLTFIKNEDKSDSQSRAHQLQHTLTKSRPLRVGYISQDWRNHPMGRLTMRLVTAHRTEKVSASCISYGANDASMVRMYVERNADRFYDISEVTSDQDAVTFIEGLKLDVLVDITSHTYRGRIAIAAYKPAQIVINYLGYPGTSGCSAFDYTAVDALVAPTDLAPYSFTEKLIYLPHIYQANFMPPDVVPCLLSDRRLCRQRMITDRVYGDDSVAKILRDSSRTWLCSFNSNKKLEPLAFQTWMQLLVESPRAILVLLDTSAKPKKALLQNALYHGVASHRLVFIKSLPWKNHLYRTSSCDMVLDTFTYGAHTTASDALWMWVPVLALEGYSSQRMPSRVASAITKSLLQKDAVVPVLQSTKQYQDMAVRLNKDISASYALHDRIASAALRQATFDYEAVQTATEAAYQAAAEIKLIQNLHPGRKTQHHIIVGSPPAAKRQEAMLDRLVQPLNDCLNKQKCPTGTVGSLAGRLLLSYPLSVSREHLHKLSRENNYDSPTVPAQQVKDECMRSFTEWLDNVAFAAIHMEEVAMLVQGCLPIVPLELLSIWVKVQPGMECKYESVIYDNIGIFFFRKTRIWIPDEHPLITEPYRAQILENAPFLKEKASVLTEPSEYIAEMISWLPKPDDGSVVFAQALHNHARCLLQGAEKVQQQGDEKDKGEEKDMHESSEHQWRKDAVLFFSALLINPSPERYMNFGVALQRLNSNAGFRIAASASLVRHAAESQKYYTEKARVAGAEHWEDMYMRGIAKFHNSNTHTKKSIVFYCYEYGNAYWGQWGPSSLEPGGGGLGGSEEAVVYLAEELARRGFTVTVFGDPPAKDLERGVIRGVIWRPHQEYNFRMGAMDCPDVFISWRYGVSLGVGSNAGKRLLWLQDLVGSSSLPPPHELPTGVHGSILVLSSFHQEHTKREMRVLGYSEVEAENVPVVMPNGIDIRHAADNMGTNSATHFVYGSSPIRGLEQVLLSWSMIRKAVPGATLSVYYGFPAHVTEQLSKSMGREKYIQWRERMAQLLDQEGVTYVGPVDHTTLARAYASAGFLLYPTNYPETGCITVQKAMAAGAIPITSRYTESVLQQLAHEWDLGPQTALTPAMDYELWIREHWVPAVIAAATAPPASVREKRQRMRASIQKQYSWAASADVLEELISA